MANIDDFMGLLKKQLEDRGITNVLNPESMAQNLATACESMIINPDHCLPFFEDGGNHVNPGDIDHDFDTLDENVGMLLFVYCKMIFQYV